MKVGEKRAALRSTAVAAGLTGRDADLLLAHVTGWSIAQLIARDDQLLSADDEVKVDGLLLRRISGEPLQYIVGGCEFYGRWFAVDSRALIPRPETEILVEIALKRCPEGARLIDVGTGSGCIATTIALERADIRVTAVDLSVDALSLAAANARQLGSPVVFAASNLLAGCRPGSFDVIASNPPYVPRGDVAGLQREVRDHEPHLALIGGSEGVEIITRLVDEASAVLRKEGMMIFEIGYNQHEAVEQIATARGWSFEVVEDLAAIPRVVVLSRHRRP